MILMIETKNGARTDMRAFSDINDADRYIKYCSRFGDVKITHADKNLIVYHCSDGSNLIRIDSDSISLNTFVPDGTLNATINPDPNYPGLDIEFLPDDEHRFKDGTNPRVLIDEAVNDGNLTLRTWEDTQHEDYTHIHTFC